MIQFGNLGDRPPNTLLRYGPKAYAFPRPVEEQFIAYCEEAGIPFACTEGVCGTCVIEVEEGMENLTPFTQEERDFLGDLDKERLACQCKIKDGCVKINF